MTDRSQFSSGYQPDPECQRSSSEPGPPRVGGGEGQPTDVSPFSSSTLFPQPTALPLFRPLTIRSAARKAQQTLASVRAALKNRGPLCLAVSRCRLATRRPCARRAVVRQPPASALRGQTGSRPRRQPTRPRIVAMSSGIGRPPGRLAVAVARAKGTLE